MNNIKYQYDFSQASTSGKPGFELFQNKKNGRHYFHFNDEKGVALLFSQGYKEHEKRDNGMESVLKNGKIRERFVLNETKEGWRFRLKAANNQEIASSQNFANKKLAVAALAWLLSNLDQPLVASSSPPASSEPTPVAPPQKLKKEQVPLPTRRTIASNKYLFKIEFFYEKEEPLRGVVKFFLSEAKEQEDFKFTGFDSISILSFIRQHLPPDCIGELKDEETTSSVVAGKISEETQPAAGGINLPSTPPQPSQPPTSPNPVLAERAVSGEAPFSFEIQTKVASIPQRGAYATKNMTVVFKTPAPAMPSPDQPLKPMAPSAVPAQPAAPTKSAAMSTSSIPVQKVAPKIDVVLKTGSTGRESQPIQVNLKGNSPPATLWHRPFTLPKIGNPQPQLLRQARQTDGINTKTTAPLSSEQATHLFQVKMATSKKL